MAASGEVYEGERSESIRGDLSRLYFDIKTLMKFKDCLCLELTIRVVVRRV